MNIPIKVTLAGIDIHVVRDKTLVERKKVIGEASYSDQKIFIDLTKAPIQSTEQAYYHELIHWILFILNEHDLRSNEKFVDTFGHLLYQAISSAVYEDTCEETV